MKKLIKDINGNVAAWVSANSLLPDGWELVPAEELAETELTVAIRDKMAEIRSERDRLLEANDKDWLIASKKGLSTTTIEANAETLRNIPEAAQSALDVLSSVEDILAYNAFEEFGE